MDNNNLKISIKHPKGDDGYRIFSIRVQTEMINKIDNIASQTGRSRNELINIFLDCILAYAQLKFNHF